MHTPPYVWFSLIYEIVDTCLVMHRPVPAICIITAQEGNEVKQRCIEAGALELFHKPLSREKLTGFIDALQASTQCVHPSRRARGVLRFGFVRAAIVSDWGVARRKKVVEQLASAPWSSSPCRATLAPRVTRGTRCHGHGPTWAATDLATESRSSRRRCAACSER